MKVYQSIPGKSISTNKGVITFNSVGILSTDDKEIQEIIKGAVGVTEVRAKKPAAKTA